jgi:hypothetical protein
MYSYTSSNLLVKRFDVRLWLRARPKIRATTAAAGQEQDGGRPPAHACSPPPTGERAGRPTQREVLLDEAARQFNARGIAATSVNQVAKRVGLTRAAVYYYVKDGEDLVFQCYLRACQ